jgi:hypothetical protein
MSRSDTEVLQELKDARARIEIPSAVIKSHHSLIIELDTSLDTTLEEYLRIIKR